MYPYIPYNPKTQKNSGLEWSSLFIDAIILVLTFEIIGLNYRNVMLNTQNVQLNWQNVISNKQSAKTGRKTLEVLNEINNKI